MKSSLTGTAVQNSRCATGTEGSDRSYLKTLFEGAFEFADDAYYLADSQGRFITGNKKVREITGYMITELVGKSLLEMEILSFKQKLRLAKLIATDRMGLPIGPEEFALTRKDGRQIPVEARVNIIDTEETGKFMFAVVRELTGREDLLEVRVAGPAAREGR